MRTGFTWKAFADFFGIPYRTVQDWQLGNREMPEYLLRLMIYRVEKDEQFGQDVKLKDE